MRCNRCQNLYSINSPFSTLFSNMILSLIRVFSITTKCQQFRVIQMKNCFVCQQHRHFHAGNLDAIKIMRSKMKWGQSSVERCLVLKQWLAHLCEEAVDELSIKLALYAESKYIFFNRWKYITIQEFNKILNQLPNTCPSSQIMTRLWLLNVSNIPQREICGSK